jgi:hypothetical protein
MNKKIIDIDNQFTSLEDGFFDEKSINKRTGNIIKNKSKEMRSIVSKSNQKQYAKGKRVKPKNLTFKGKKHTDKSKKLMAHKGEKNGMYGVRLTGKQNHMYGKSHDDEVKSHLAEVARNRPKDQYCVHCDEYFTKQIYSRYHGNNCKKAPK